MYFWVYSCFFQNNLAIGIIDTLIDIEAIKFVFLYFLGFVRFFITGFKIMRIDMYLLFRNHDRESKKKRFFLFFIFLFH